MRNNIEEMAHRLGIHVSTYSPGDGYTRYRFFTTNTDYFAGSGMGTALGRKEAETWLRGYEAGMSATLDRLPNKVRFKYGYPKA